MHSGPLDQELLEVIRRHETRAVFHYTRCEALPSIVKEEALYARAELDRRGIEYKSTHYYGTDRHEEVLGEFVSCSGLPPWGMMQSETKEIAVVRLAPETLAIPGTCFCPGWSPRGQYDPDEIVTWTGPDALEELYTGDGPQWVLPSEMFVPARIDLRAIEGFVFFDRESAERALPRIQEEAAASSLDHELKLSVEPSRFPRSWQEQGPPWEETDVPTF